MRKFKIYLKSKIAFIILQLLIIVFCINSFINAQSQFSAGPTVGINFATFKGKDIDQIGISKSKDGLYIGVFFNYHFAELFALQPEIAFTKKGSVVSSSLYADLAYIENYFEIPVLLKFYIPIENTSTIKPNIYAGPAFAFNVVSRAEVNSNGTIWEPFSNNTKSFDLGLAFGGGVGFLVGRGMLDFSLRYTFGFVSTNNFGTNLTITNSVFALITNYAFSL